ncbi:hypothetical protein BJV77DRAFT_1028388 [Russula vinacea]|nr:hypothetical protein BJV77DRAFT_1028388 [Russula vinacea]
MQKEDHEDVASDGDDVDSCSRSRCIALLKLDQSLPWTALTVSFPETIDVDVDDDLGHELAFYKQTLHGAKAARALAALHNT